MQQLYEVYRNRGFVVVAVESWGRSATPYVRSLQKEIGISYPFLRGGPPYGYAAWASPTVVLLDRSGRVVASRQGQCDWTGEPVQNLIESLVGSGPLAQQQR